MLFTFDSFALLNYLAVCLTGVFAVISLTYLTSFSAVQQLSFPLLNTLNSRNILFFLFLLLCSNAATSESFFAIGSSVNFYVFFFQNVLLLALFCFFYISIEFNHVKHIYQYEYSLIILFSILGLLLIMVCNDFLMFYLAVELQSLAFYALASFNKNSEFCVEAGMKYFILGALTSGFILFGFSLVYASFGTFSFESFDRFNSLVFCPSAICGVLFFSFAILFKLGAFPFHFWLCDVYDGSFLSLTAFFSIIPKVILLSFFIRFHFVILNSSLESFQYLFVLSGMSSICFAATAALYQKRLKRLLAYSAISHVGFLVVGVGCLSLDSIKACTIYITLYILMSLLIFGILFWSGFENKNQKFLVAWTSCFERNSGVAICFSLAMFSVAGIPPLAGFYSKLGILLCLLSEGHLFSCLLIVFFSSIACFYYIKLIKIFYFSSITKSSFWFGSGDNHVEFFVCFGTILVTTLLVRPNFILDCITITALALS